MRNSMKPADVLRYLAWIFAFIVCVASVTGLVISAFNPALDWDDGTLAGLSLCSGIGIAAACLSGQ